MIQSLMPLLALLLQWVTKNKRPQNYTFLFMFCALIGVMLVISKGNIYLLFGATKPYIYKSIHAVRRYVLGHLHKWRFPFSILVTTSVHNTHLFLWLYCTSYHCEYISLYKIYFCTVYFDNPYYSLRIILYVNSCRSDRRLLLEYGKSFHFIH